MADQKLIRRLAEAELDRALPKSQEDCCALAARVSVAAGDAPTNDIEFTAAAIGAAKGLFGPAFVEACEGQRRAWVDMCENALRDAVKEAAAER